MGVENPCLFVNGVISTQRLTNIHLLAIKVILHPKVLIKLQPILLDIILQELIEEWGCRFGRSEEHTSELQSLMRISYAVFCLKKKKNILLLLILQVHRSSFCNFSYNTPH